MDGGSADGGVIHELWFGSIGIVRDGGIQSNHETEFLGDPMGLKRRSLPSMISGLVPNLDCEGQSEASSSGLLIFRRRTLVTCV